MNEPAKTILEEFERDPTLGDLHALHEVDHPVWVLDALAKLRLWAGVPGARDTRRPSIEFLDALLGRGKEAAVKLFREYEATVPPAESLLVLRAIGRLARHAKMQKAIGWDLDNVRPDDGKSRLLVTFDPALDERLRATAASEKQSLSGFVRLAVEDRIAVVEKRRPSRATA